MDIITPLVQAFTNASPAVQQMAVAIGAAAAAAGPLTSGLGALTTTIGTMMKASTAAGGGLSGLSAGLNSTGIQMVAVTAAFVAWGIAAKKAHELIQNVDQGMEDVAETTGTWTEETAGMIAEGASLSDVLDDLSSRASETHDILNQDYSGGFLGLKGALQDVGAAGIRTAKQSEILGQVAKNAEKAILANTSSWEEYIAAVDEWNAKAPTSEAMIQGISVAQFELATGTGVAAHEVRKLEQGYRDAASGLLEYNNQLSYTKPELENITAETESFDRAMLQAAQSTKDGTLVTDEHKAALIRQYTEQRKVGEVAERVAAMQEESAARTAAALQQQQAAAEEAARGQASLISSMKDATQEMFNQQILAAVDPAEVGVEAWAALGQELGLLDQTQVNLATAAEDLIGAFKDGAVPTENMAEAAGALFAESEKLEPKFGEILDHFAAAPGLIGPSKDELDGLNEKLALTGEVGAETEGSIKAFADQIIITKTPVRELKEEADDLYDSFYQLTGKSWEVSFVTSYSTSGTPPSPPTGGPGGRQQMGGVIPGRPGSLQGPYWLHGGEVVSNPYQYGAVGGPGGPPAPTNNYGGDTFNVNINDRMAAALFLDQMRRQRGDKLNARM
jgi:hypothetical protein